VGGLNAKFDSFKKLINELKPIALFISEANLNKDKSNKFLTINDYSLL